MKNFKNKNIYKITLLYIFKILKREKKILFYKGLSVKF